MNENDSSPQASERKTQAVSGGNVANLVKRISTELQSKADVPVRAGASDVKQRRAKAAFSYTPQNDDELRLEVDDVIDILGEEEEGWWKGRLKGKVGVFPANFVKPLEASPWPEGRHESEEKPKTEEPEGLNVGASAGEIQPKKVAGVGFGNIFAANQKIELRNVKSSAGGGPVPSSVTVISDAPKKGAEGASSTSAKSDGLQKATVTNGKKPLPNPSSSLSEPVPGQKQKEYAKALFAYDAENEDELSLEEGDVIVIVSKEVEDAGWWLGELSGKRGVFPDNFVTQISAEEAEKAKKSAGVSSGVGSAAVPPTVPAKPPKPATAPPPMLPDSSKLASLFGDAKQEAPKQTLPKYSIDNHSKTEAYGAEKGTAMASTVSDKDKPGIYRKPLVPLVGMAKAKPLSGRLFGGSGANSPSSDEKLDEVDGQADGVNSSDGDKLIHPTASRVRNPHRRPPSQAFLKDMAVDPALVRSTIIGTADESPSLPKNQFASSSSSFEIINNGKHRPEEYVRREEFEQLQAAFESFKRETRERIREMEKLLAAQSSKHPKV